MKPIYVQHLLKVLLEEYDDIDFLLGSLEVTSRRDAQKIRRLLDKLNTQNERLLARFEATSN